MQVYVARDKYEVCGVYDSLTAVKQDFYDDNEETWTDILDMTEEEYTEYMYGYEIFLSKEELTSFDHECSYTPLDDLLTDSATIINML